MLEIKKVECPQEKISIKCPYQMTPSRVVIHNTANDAPAKNEIAYMHSNPNKVSFHFAVDDTEIIQGIELDRNSFNAGDGAGKGNREGIAIEICYSKSGGERFEKAQRNAAELTAYLLKKYGWGIDKITKHQDYNGKNCPHRTLGDYGWDFFLKLVESFMYEQNAPLKSNEEIVAEVIAGAWGNGDERKQRLTTAGYDAKVIQQRVNAALLGGAPTVKVKTDEEIAREVIAGKWGNGADRKKKLAAAGYNASKIQSIVNKLLKGN